MSSPPEVPGRARRARQAAGLWVEPLLAGGPLFYASWWAGQAFALSPPAADLARVAGLVVLSALLLARKAVRARVGRATPRAGRGGDGLGRLVTSAAAMVLAGLVIWAGWKDPAHRWLSLLVAAVLAVPVVAVGQLWWQRREWVWLAVFAIQVGVLGLLLVEPPPVERRLMVAVTVTFLEIAFVLLVADVQFLVLTKDIDPERDDQPV